jgi:molybdopterin converting factor small subunit
VSALKVYVEYKAVLIEVTGKSREVVELKEGATVGDLVKTLAEKYGEDFEVGFKRARKRRMLKVFVEVNSRASTYPECAGVELRDGDRVVITPLPLAWGG